jgi:hypothetical protein
MSKLDTELKKQKYLYLMDTVAENGYDTTKFSEFLRKKHANITIDEVSFDQLKLYVQ